MGRWVAMLLALLALAPAAGAKPGPGGKPDPAAGLAGTYRVEGQNPGAGSGYQGLAQITRQGAEVWHVQWAVDRSSFEGLGLLTGEVLSVAFTDARKRFVGIIAYRVVGDGTLEARWTAFGSRGMVGRERLRPLRGGPQATPRPATPPPRDTV